MAYLPVQEEDGNEGDEEASTSHSIEEETQLSTRYSPQEEPKKEAAQSGSKKDNTKKSRGAKNKARRKSKGGSQERNVKGEEEEDLDKILKSLDIKIVSCLAATHCI